MTASFSALLRKGQILSYRRNRKRKRGAGVVTAQGKSFITGSLALRHGHVPVAGEPVKKDKHGTRDRLREHGGLFMQLDRFPYL